MEETDVMMSARCPHCRRTVLLEESRARSGTILDCPWPDCSRQVTVRGNELVSPWDLLGDVLGSI